MACGAALRTAIRFGVSVTLTGIVGFAYLFLISGAVLPLLLVHTGGELDLEKGLPQVQVALGGVLLITAILFVRRYWRRPVTQLVRAAWLPLLLAALALASVAWSIDPGLSLRRAVALCGTVLMGMFLVSSFGYRRSVMLVVALLALIAVGSLLTSLLFPDVGIHQAGAHLGRWRGLYLHKNLLGREMALAVGLFLAAAFRERGLVRGFWLALTLTGGLLLLQAQSATGILAAVAAVAVLLVLRAVRGRPLVASALVMLGLAGALVVGLMAASAPERLVGLLNRDLSFTGRTQLWSDVLDKVLEQPWLGHGYGAFWGSVQGADVSSRLGWRVVHAHNSWLDIGLALGVAGLCLIIGLVALPFLRRLWSRRPLTEDEEMGAVFTVVALVVAMSDSILLGPNNLFLLLLIIQFIASGSPHGVVVRRYGRASGPAVVGTSGNLGPGP